MSGCASLQAEFAKNQLLLERLREKRVVSTPGSEESSLEAIIGRYFPIFR